MQQYTVFGHSVKPGHNYDYKWQNAVNTICVDK